MSTMKRIGRVRGRAIAMGLALVWAGEGAIAAETTPVVNEGRQEAVEIGRAWGHKFPEQIVLVVSQGTNGPANIMTAGWAMTASGDPSSVAVSIAKERYSHGLIMQTRQFVVSFPGDDIEKAMLFCGTKSGRDVDKFAATGLTAKPSKKVKPPIIEQCIANFECEMTHAVDVGSHTIFVGRIVYAWQHEKADNMRRIYSLGGLGGRRFGAWPWPTKAESAIAPTPLK